jgi:hypothetical protein
MYIAVVRPVHIPRNRIATDGKYLASFHVLSATGRPYVMQLVEFVLTLQHVKLHDPNMKLEDYYSIGAVLLST